MSSRIVIVKPEHEVVYADLAALLERHADKMTKIEVLAIAANMLGKLVAMQDQRTITPDIAMQTISANIEHGNRQVFDLLNQIGGSKQ